jgi:hypothetical protein
MADKTYSLAKNFIYRNARPLDFARFRYHFENGGKDAVLNALAAYQNTDGGFGHALEPDSWNPNTTPIQTWTATEILREIGLTDSEYTISEYPIIQGILRYLASGNEFDGHFWHGSIASNNDYPHAPWWGYSEADGTSGYGYNPTANLAGFIIRFAQKNSDLYKLGCQIAKEAVDAYFARDLLDDMHVACCYIRLLQYIEEAGVSDIIDLNALRERLKLQVKHCISDDITTWGKGYDGTPSWFIESADSVFYADNKVTADYECEFIVNTQLPDGTWEIPWGWGDYPNEWAISKNWWKANGVVLNLLYLKRMGKLPKTSHAE